MSGPYRRALLAGVIVLALAPGLTRLELRTDGLALAPSDDPAVQRDVETRATFGVCDSLIVLVRPGGAAGIFEAGALRRLDELTRALGRMPELRGTRVTSLATEKGDRFREGSLDRRGLLEPLPRTPEEIELLRQDLAALQIYTGTLVAEDGSGAVVLVEVPEGTDRQRLYHDIEGVVADFREQVGEISLLGAPVAEAMLGHHILADLGLPDWLVPGGRHRGVGLVPLAVLILSLVLLVAFRRLAAAVIPLVQVGACLVGVFAIMAWLGQPIYLTITVLPVILVSLGVADEIHILSRYRHIVCTGAPAAPADLAVAALDQVAAPIVKTSLTTAAAFLSFALSPIPAVRNFGIFAALGILLCMTWSLCVTPALLVIAGPDRLASKARRVPGMSAPGHVPGRLVAWVARRRWWVLVALFLVLAAALPGLGQVEVQDSWESGFDPACELMESTRWFNERFLGTHLLHLELAARSERFEFDVSGTAIGEHDLMLPALPGVDPRRLLGATVVILPRIPADPSAWETEGIRAESWSAWVRAVEVDPAGLVRLSFPVRRGSPRLAFRPRAGESFVCQLAIQPLLVPVVLEAIGEFEGWLNRVARPAAGGVLGPARYLSTANFIVKARSPGSRRLPDDPGQARLLWKHLEAIRGEHRVGQLVDAERGRALVTLYLKQASYQVVAGLQQSIDRYGREHLAEHGISISYAGDVAVSQAMIRAIVTTQVRSLLAALALILLLVSLLSGSIRIGLWCVAPSALAVGVTFAFMGWREIPLGVATSMFAGMSLGIGVDYAIHLMAPALAAARAGTNSDEAMVHAARVAGPGILVDAVAVGTGFGVLTLSSVPANAVLGTLALIGVATCAVATLLLLPASAAALPLRRARDHSGGPDA